VLLKEHAVPSAGDGGLGECRMETFVSWMMT
jgi:hypothetical protein